MRMDPSNFVMFEASVSAETELHVFLQGGDQEARQGWYSDATVTEGDETVCSARPVAYD